MVDKDGNPLPDPSRVLFPDKPKSFTMPKTFLTKYACAKAYHNLVNGEGAWDKLSDEDQDIRADAMEKVLARD